MSMCTSLLGVVTKMSEEEDKALVTQAKGGVAHLAGKAARLTEPLRRLGAEGVSRGLGLCQHVHFEP